jgi:poly-gamma-glutamate synthesis protein (capsule biosynthesis protein)
MRSASPAITSPIAGPKGFEDTIAELDRLGIAHNGAGANEAEARAPAILERAGRTIALLSYNAVGPELSWAGPTVPAAPSSGSKRPMAVPAAAGGSRPDRRAELAAMADDIESCRARADIVVVALHKGITHRPAELAPYERPLARAAIDSGADIVIGHHAHIVRGIEYYRGKPIFHGLGNGVVVTMRSAPARTIRPRRMGRKAQDDVRVRARSGLPLAPFHPEAVNGMIARLCWHEGGRARPASYRSGASRRARPVPAVNVRPRSRIISPISASARGLSAWTERRRMAGSWSAHQAKGWDDERDLSRRRRPGHGSGRL